MIFRLKDLFCDLNDSNIIVYGTGVYAQYIFDKLQMLSMVKRIKAFVVSGEKESHMFNGIPVYRINELHEIYDDEIILIATSDRWKNEIQNELNKHLYKKVICLSDYEYPKEDDMWDVYRDKGVDVYLQRIQERYVEQQMIENMHTDMAVIDKSFRPEKNNSQIVFVIGMKYAMPRTLKIVGALIRKGYDCVLLFYGNATEELVAAELEEYGLIPKYNQSIEELMYNMLRYNPLAYYIDPFWKDCTWAAVIVQHKEFFGKIVATRYDVISGYLSSATDREQLLEKYFLENADGIVWRWFAQERLEQRGMKFSGKSLQFPDPCTGNGEGDIKMSYDNEPLKLVCVAGLLQHVLNDILPEEDWERTAKIWEILEKIKGQNCCFHMFTWSATEEELKKCKALEKKHTKFKLFCGYEHKQILRMLPKYDYGCLIDKKGKKLPAELSVNGSTLGAAREDSCTGRYTDYLYAGLPVIAGSPKKWCDFLEGKGVLINMPLEDLDLKYLRMNRNTYKKNVLKVRKELSADARIGELINFFHEVASDGE